MDEFSIVGGALPSSSLEHVSSEPQSLVELDQVTLRGLTVWFTGLSGAGKTTIAQSVRTTLQARNVKVELLDGDELRKSLSRGLGYSREDRSENISRISSLACSLMEQNNIVLVAAISPYRSGRESARKLLKNFIEVYVNAPLGICEQRDPKGLYKLARRGVLKQFTGIDDPYECPLCPEVECRTDLESPAESAQKVLTAIMTSLIEPR